MELSHDYHTKQLNHAKGCLAGQLIGDNLGALVEFMQPDEIALSYPNGVTKMQDGGRWGILAGQPTDDSEMALALSHSLAESGRYDSFKVLKAYQEWFKSEPFDYGNTISDALSGKKNFESQANGALMRVSPIGIFGKNTPIDRKLYWAETDAKLTHPNPVCTQANQLFVLAIHLAIYEQLPATDIYESVLDHAKSERWNYKLISALKLARTSSPDDYCVYQGWVLIAFQNAFYQLLHADNIIDGLKNSISGGGDTDTNAAIAGALLGAHYGLESFPHEWIETLRNCKPSTDNQHCQTPRPEKYWPNNFELLAEQLM